MRAAVRTVLVIGTLLSGLEVPAIRVEGFVRDGFTRLPLRGAVVTLERANVAPEPAVTRIDGHYRFEVRAGERAVIRFAAGDRVPRFVVFDATEVPREWTDVLEARLDMRAYPPMAGLDSTLLASPAGICRWSVAEENMVWDTDRSAPLVERWKAAATDHLAQHPELRPSDLQRWAAGAFDQVMEDHFRLNKWLIAAGLGILWLLPIGLRHVLSRLGPWGRGTFLIALLAGCVACVMELATAAGPLRFLAMFGLLVGIIVAFNLVVLLLERQRHAAFGPMVREEASGPEEEEEPEDDEADGEEEADRAAHPPTSDGAPRSGVLRWWEKNRTGVVLFASMALLMTEWRFGLENTLKVWPLVALGLVGGAAIAWIIATRRQRRSMEPVGALAAGGATWMTLPLVTLATLSCLNRMAADPEVRCATWPVVKVHEGSKGGISVHVAILGERERLEMDRAIKEQLTTLDSLRCCVRRGAFGFDFVERVVPVITGDDPR